MKKVAIVGVEGSGKTVMLAGLGDLYTYPDEEGYLLVPKNFSTAAYVAEKIERMRKGEWPAATADDVMEGLDWTLKRRIQDGRLRPETICEVSFLDFAGEVYRTAFGVGAGNASLAEQAEELKRYVREADDLLVLINLRDVIVHGIRDRRVQEAMWITKAILDAALAEESGRKAPRAAIVLSQADSYADTIKDCGGAQGVLRKHLPYVAYDYEWLDVFAASAVDKTKLDDDGNAVPAEDFTSQGLLPIMTWIRGEKVSDGGGRGATALPVGTNDIRVRAGTPCPPTASDVHKPTASDAHKKIQLWENGPYWADTNIGAENPWDSGYYFWWGGTVGYKYENGAFMASDGSSSNFSFRDANVPTCNRDIAALHSAGWIVLGEERKTFFGQLLGLREDSVLSPKHDAAQVQWGGGWRMPTKQELDDLCNKCDWIWTIKNGVNGCVVRGRDGYASASIFLPCAGRSFGTSLIFAGSYGCYWSSVPISSYGGGISEYLYFHLGHHATDGCYRNCGCSVRPVKGFIK